MAEETTAQSGFKFHTVREDGKKHEKQHGGNKSSASQHRSASAELLLFENKRRGKTEPYKTWLAGCKRRREKRKDRKEGRRIAQRVEKELS